MIALVVGNQQNIVVGLRCIAILLVGNKSWSRVVLWFDRSAWRNNFKNRKTVLILACLDKNHEKRPKIGEFR